MAGTIDPALLTSADVGRVIDRMAHQLIERAATVHPDRADGGLGDLVLVGIPTRGAPLACRLAARIEAFTGTSVDVGTADHEEADLLHVVAGSPLLVVRTTVRDSADHPLVHSFSRLRPDVSQVEFEVSVGGR